MTDALAVCVGFGNIASARVGSSALRWRKSAIHAKRPRMTPAARLSAVIEVLEDLDRRIRPATDALRDWALSHRLPVRAIAPRSACCSMTRCASAPRPASPPAPTRRAPRRSACSRSRAACRSTRSPRSAMARVSRPSRSPTTSAPRLPRIVSPRRPCMCAAISRNGSRPRSSAPSAMMQPRKARRSPAARPSTCASTR